MISMYRTKSETMKDKSQPWENKIKNCSIKANFLDKVIEKLLRCNLKFSKLKGNLKDWVKFLEQKMRKSMDWEADFDKLREQVRIIKLMSIDKLLSINKMQIHWEIKTKTSREKWANLQMTPTGNWLKHLRKLKGWDSISEK